MCDLEIGILACDFESSMENWVEENICTSELEEYDFVGKDPCSKGGGAMTCKRDPVTNKLYWDPPVMMPCEGKTSFLDIFLNLRSKQHN